MARSMRVTNLDALRDVKSGIAEFIDAARQALTEADSDVQRTVNWLESEARSYWQSQIKRRSDQVAEAKNVLARAQHAPRDERPSAIMERKALEKAQRRLAHAQEKLERSRRWAAELHREHLMFRGQLQNLSGAVESELPRAIAMMNHLIESVEAYLREQAAAESGPSPTTADDDALPSVARAGSATMKEQRWIDLRRNTPDEVDRRDARTFEQPGTLAAGDALDVDDQAVLTKLVGERDEPESPLRVILAPDVLEHARVYFERREPCVAGDSGWYIGRADATAPPEAGTLESISVMRLVQSRPDLGRLLALPVGALVVQEGSQLQAIFDGDDTLVWSPRLAL